MTLAHLVLSLDVQFYAEDSREYQTQKSIEGSRPLYACRIAGYSIGSRGAKCFDHRLQGTGESGG